EVFARHFEILARTQTSLVTIVDPGDSGFQEGEYVFKAQVDALIREGKNVAYSFNRQNDLSTIRKYSGALTAMIYGDFGSTFGHMITTQEVSKIDSPIARIVSGQPMNHN